MSVRTFLHELGLANIPNSIALHLGEAERVFSDRLILTKMLMNNC